MNATTTLRVIGMMLTGWVLTASVAPAQWLDQPTPGLPRTPDGKPNLTAPAPRTADGKPDLSGLWQISGLGYSTNITDVEMLPDAQALFRRRLETYGNDDPVVRCLPEGPRTSLAGLDPLRIVQAPAMVVVLYETGPYRQIFTDGRTLPRDPNPTWMGYSVGRWDGDTFVVESAGFNDKTWLDFLGHPHSEALRVTERFRRVDFGHMQLAITYDDPKSYTRPFTITVGVAMMPDADLIENVCQENEKDQHRLVGRAADDLKTARPVSPAILVGYAGAYDLGPLGTWTVSVDAGQLRIEMSDGGGKQATIAQSDTTFLFPPIGGTVRFVQAGNGRAASLVLTTVEGDLSAARKD